MKTLFIYLFLSFLFIFGCADDNATTNNPEPNLIKSCTYEQVYNSVLEICVIDNCIDENCFEGCKIVENDFIKFMDCKKGTAEIILIEGESPEERAILECEENQAYNSVLELCSFNPNCEDDKNEDWYGGCFEHCTIVDHNFDDLISLTCQKY